MCNVLTHTSQSHLTHILNTYSKYMSTHIRHATIISHQQQHKYHTTIPYSLHNQATTTSVWIVNRTSFVGFWYVHVARNGKDATSKSPVSRQGWKRVGHSALIHHKASAFWGDFVSAADSHFFSSGKSKYQGYLLRPFSLACSFCCCRLSINKNNGISRTRRVATPSLFSRIVEKSLSRLSKGGRNLCSLHDCGIRLQGGYLKHHFCCAVSLVCLSLCRNIV